MGYAAVTCKETLLANFHVYPITDGDSFWVKASSSEEARRLIALNVPEATQVEETAHYRCEEDDHKSPPHGMIYHRLGRPISITRR